MDAGAIVLLLRLNDLVIKYIGMVFDNSLIASSRRFGGGTELGLILSCLGAGHDHSKMLGKLRNTRLDFFAKNRELTSQSSSFEYKLYFCFVLI